MKQLYNSGTWSKTSNWGIPMSTCPSCRRNFRKLVIITDHSGLEGCLRTYSLCRSCWKNRINYKPQQNKEVPNDR